MAGYNIVLSSPCSVAPGYFMVNLTLVEKFLLLLHDKTPCKPLLCMPDFYRMRQLSATLEVRRERFHTDIDRLHERQPELARRSEESRVAQECVSTCRDRWWRCKKKKKKQ